MKKLQYEEFKSIMVEKIIEYLPEQFSILTPKCVKSYIVNGCSEELKLQPPVSGANWVIPSLDMHDLWITYLNELNRNEVAALEVVLCKTAEMYKKNIAMRENHNKYKIDKTKIFFQVIGTEFNQELLKTVTHRKLLDLAIIYRVLVKDTDDGIQSYIITNEIAKKNGLTEEELYELAQLNTYQLFPCEPQVIKGALTDIREANGDPQLYESIKKNNESVLIMVTNKKMINGAYSILNFEILDDLVLKFDSDLYILPGSLHEIYILSSEGRNPDEWASYVLYCNRNLISKDMILTHSIYQYNRKSGLTLAAVSHT